MAVDEKVAVGGVLVLAYAALDQRRLGERRKTADEEIARGRETGGRHLALERVRIDGRAVRVERQLEAARLQIGHSVNDVLQVGKVGPHRKGRRGKAPVAGRRPEEEYFLARGLDAVAQHLGK